MLQDSDENQLVEILFIPLWIKSVFLYYQAGKIQVPNIGKVFG